METIEYGRLDVTNDNREYTTNIRRFPDYCPICNKIQEPKLVDAYLISSNFLELIFKCTNRDCNQLFLSKSYDNGYGFTISDSFPKTAIKIKFDEVIENLSPLFVEIYNQANSAEALDLKHVAGMGYRKSLEFLVKDYLINFKNHDEETIKKTFLGACIKNFLSDNVKQVAERATWLGNDETHYHRIWENKDIEDLKKLIQLTNYHISSEIETARYLEDMVNPKR
ncbi:hypothetical protein [Metabacillus dongyingensis]|uniref:hypothetical protein n=1 Tax=Metabacillus dongyingensis TaxID=2874282 RepID=UPI001CBE4A94|nr:hypothetical protein [Metabacillus dongyingensis]UAL53502.1 hypothetical protein K8L98_06870 [Metabacillus dongyingensis]